MAQAPKHGEVLDEVERLLEELADASYWVAATAPMGDVIEGWCGTPQLRVRASQLLTALRSLPPVPMQQLLDQWIARAEEPLGGWTDPWKAGESYGITACASELAAALRSLASQNSTEKITEG